MQYGYGGECRSLDKCAARVEAHNVVQLYSTWEDANDVRRRMEGSFVNVNALGLEGNRSELTVIINFLFRLQGSCLSLAVTDTPHHAFDVPHVGPLSQILFAPNQSPEESS